jgi:hypothetical protein
MIGFLRKNIFAPYINIFIFIHTLSSVPTHYFVSIRNILDWSCVVTQELLLHATFAELKRRAILYQLKWRLF